MIINGYWKWELQKLSWEISLWSKLTVFDAWSKHRLTRAVLYSAIIIRKAIEDDTEAGKAGLDNLPELRLLTETLSAKKFPYIGEKESTARGKMWASDYDAGETMEMKISTVCNQLIHSYVWNLAYKETVNGCHGFFVASDKQKEKCVYFVSFSEWQKIIKLAITEGTF